MYYLLWKTLKWHKKNPENSKRVWRSHSQDDTEPFPIMQLCSSSPSELALLPDMTAQFFQGLFEGLLMQSVPESSDIKYNGWGGAGRVTGPGWIVSPLSWFHLPSTYFPSASCWPESCTPKGVRRARTALTSSARAKHMFCSAGSPPDPPSVWPESVPTPLTADSRTGQQLDKQKPSTIVRLDHRFVEKQERNEEINWENFAINNTRHYSFSYCDWANKHWHFSEISKLTNSESIFSPRLS